MGTIPFHVSDVFCWFYKLFLIFSFTFHLNFGNYDKCGFGYINRSVFHLLAVI